MMHLRSLGVKPNAKLQPTFPRAVFGRALCAPVLAAHARGACTPVPPKAARSGQTRRAPAKPYRRTTVAPAPSCCHKPVGCPLHHPSRTRRGAMIPQRGCPVQDVFCVEARPARGRACRKALFPGAERNRCAGGCGAGAQRVGCAMPLGYAAGIVRPHRHGAVGHSRRNGACPRHLAPARRCRFVPTRLFRPAGTAKRMRPAYRCRRGWLHKR